MRVAAEQIIAAWKTTTSPLNLHDETRKLTLRVLLDAALWAERIFPSIEEASRHIGGYLSRLGRFTPE